jgi:nucleoside-diphosphate-sugar epimerase
MTSVVVTGAAGFLGSRVAAALEKRSDLQVTRVVRPGSGPSIADQAPGRIVAVDLLNEEAVVELLARIRPQAVINAAGRVAGTPRELFLDNTATTVVLVNAILKESRDLALTVLGSAAEYEPPPDGTRILEDHLCAPQSVYGHSKWAASEYCQLAQRRGLRFNILRVFNPVDEINSSAQVLGAFIARAVAQLSAPEPVVNMGRLDAVRDFVAVDDLLALIVRIVETGTTGEIINVCSGEGHRVRDLLHGIITHSKRMIRIVESGPVSTSGRADIAVGDPRRFLMVSGLARPSSVEDVLRKAWDRAVAERAP